MSRSNKKRQREFIYLFIYGCCPGGSCQEDDDDDDNDNDNTIAIPMLFQTS